MWQKCDFLTVDLSLIVLFIQHLLLTLVALPHSVHIYNIIFTDEWKMKIRCKAFKNPYYQSGIDYDVVFALFCLGFSQHYSYCVSDHKKELDFSFPGK